MHKSYSVVVYIYTQLLLYVHIISILLTLTRNIKYHFVECVRVRVVLLRLYYNNFNDDIIILFSLDDVYNYNNNMKNAYGHFLVVTRRERKQYRARIT